MPLFDRFKKPTAKKAPAAPKAAKKKTDDAVVAPAASTSPESNVAGTVSREFAFTLIKPHVSEKAARLADRGIYVFDVPVTVNKVEVRKAVEALYKVNVIKVRTIRSVGKPVLRGKIAGRRNRWKKAMVELKKGQTLNLVEGV
jgi:large subunit ribosomal protein L23